MSVRSGDSRYFRNFGSTAHIHAVWVRGEPTSADAINAFPPRASVTERIRVILVKLEISSLDKYSQLSVLYGMQWVRGRI
jgi:hypothetical protein